MAVFDPLQEIIQKSKVEDRLGYDIFRARLHLVFEALDLLIQVGQPGIGADSNHESGSRPDRIPAQIQPPVQVVDNVHQSDRIHVKHRRRIGIVPHLRRISRNADQVADSSGRCPQQVRLNAEHVAIAARIVQDGFDPDRLLHEQRKRLVAHARRRPRAVGNVHRVHAHRLDEPRALDFFLDVDALGRHNLDHRHKFPSRQLCPKAGALRYRNAGGSRRRSGMNCLRNRGLAARRAYS